MENNNKLVEFLSIRDSYEEGFEASSAWTSTFIAVAVVMLRIAVAYSLWLSEWMLPANWWSMEERVVVAVSVVDWNAALDWNVCILMGLAVSLVSCSL